MATPLALVYETMPPTSGGGCAPRGDAFTRAVAQHGAFGPVAVYTTTSNPSPIEGTTIYTVGGGSERRESLAHRLLGELAFGLRVAMHVLRSNPRTLWVISTPSYVAMLVVAMVVRLRRARYALDIRDIYPQAYIAAGLLRQGGLPARLLSSFSKQAYSGATAIITATEGLEVAVRNIVPAAEPHTIINGFSRGRDDVAPVQHERFTVCFHGVLGYFQDSASLLEVGRQLEAHNIDMVVIGYGRDAPSFELSGVGNLRFLGRLPYDQTIQEVARCHVGLSLRKDEEISADSFPVKVWEYLGLGMPTLVAPRSDAGDFVVRNGCGYVLDAGDVERAVSTIVALRDDPKLYEEMSARALTAVAPYSRASQAAQVAQILSTNEQSSSAAGDHDAQNAQ